MHFHRRTERSQSGLGEIILATRLHEKYVMYELTAKRRLVYFRPPMQLKLYSREWCSWCIDAKDYLSEKGYRFQEIDVGKDRQAYEEMKQLSAQTYVPTFVAGDKVLSNFDTEQLQRFLNEHEINP
jgi:glutaredoxin 3